MRAAIWMCLLGALLCAPASWACDTQAWNLTTGSPQSDDPDTNPANNPSGTDLGPFPRYSGACGMRPGNNIPSFVIDNSPAGETSYRTRFYVYTGQAGSASTPATVMRAFKDNDGLGTPVFELRYTRGSTASTGAWSVWSNGASRLNVPNIAEKRWYFIEIVYTQGQPLTLITRSLGVKTTTNSSGAISGLIHSVGLGSFTAVANSNTLHFDSFGSSRLSAELGALCRGDANNDLAINIFDTVVATNERVHGTLAAGQPDCNEDGAVNIFDNACIVNRRLAGAVCNING